MKTERTFIDDLKYQLKYGGTTVQLISLNVGVFLLISILGVFARLMGLEAEAEMNEILSALFSLQTDTTQLITHPWGIFTSIFAHFSFWHLAMNMLFLYFSGKIFESIFDAQRMWGTYLLGGLTGSLFEILAHYIFPVLQGKSVVIVGASGSIMAIFAAMAFHRPRLQVNLFGIIPVPLIALAGFFILTDILSLGLNDGTAHFAHLGGVVIGMVSVQNLYNKNNIISIYSSLMKRITDFLKNLFSSNSKLKVKKGGATRGPAFKTDEEYNFDKKKRQEKIDLILDKISKSGYDSLTKAEKEFLFDQSKNG
ncbi:MAG: rhomboid family intramembrane serine protease [Flavobacteriia bacterium]|jgi:membrane associated rhomboid family serine protease